MIDGSTSVLYSKEGVTQGDPLSMFMYAIGTMPLISSLNRPDKHVKVWYADDASACGELGQLRDWFHLLRDRGPLFGYFPDPAKSLLVVDKRFTTQAKEMFEEFGVQVVNTRRLLGGEVVRMTNQNLLLIWLRSGCASYRVSHYCCQSTPTGDIYSSG